MFIFLFQHGKAATVDFTAIEKLLKETSQFGNKSKLVSKFEYEY